MTHTADRRTTWSEIRLILVVAAAIAVLAGVVVGVVRLLRPQPPSADAMPLAAGLVRLGTEEAGDMVSDLGRFQYVVAAGSRQQAAGAPTGEEVRYLERHGWLLIESQLYYWDEAVRDVRIKDVPPDATGASVEMFSRAENVCAFLESSLSEQTSQLGAPSDLLGSPPVVAAFRAGRPVLAASLEFGRCPR